MIIPLTSEHSGYDEYIVCPRAPATVADLRERMMQRAKVRPGSYAHRLIDNLHAAIFIQSLDVKADYLAYFTSEYESFADYLNRRERLSVSIVKKLAKSFDVSTGMYRFEHRYAFLNDTHGIEFLTRLIEDSI